MPSWMARRNGAITAPMTTHTRVTLSYTHPPLFFHRRTWCIYVSLSYTENHFSISYIKQIHTYTSLFLPLRSICFLCLSLLPIRFLVYSHSLSPPHRPSPYSKCVDSSAHREKWSKNRIKPGYMMRNGAPFFFFFLLFFISYIFFSRKNNLH